MSFRSNTIAGIAFLFVALPTTSWALQAPPTGRVCQPGQCDDLGDPGASWDMGIRTLYLTKRRWVPQSEVNERLWPFIDINNVNWAHAARNAARMCDQTSWGEPSPNQTMAGLYNGHQNSAKGPYGLLCTGKGHGTGVVIRDATLAEIGQTGWAFSDINWVNWAQAARAAERLCASANGGFAGGHFNGNQKDGNFGLVCHRVGAQWFDATGPELAAIGWGFATPKLDDVHWAQAMRAATGFCQGKGFEGGFMNGHQAPNKYGVVCQKGLDNSQEVFGTPQ